MTLRRQQSSSIVKLAAAAAVSLCAHMGPSAHAQNSSTANSVTRTQYSCPEISDIACRNYAQGMYALQDKQFDNAQAYFEWVIEHAKDFTPAYIGRAAAYEQLGKYNEALKDLDAAVLNSPWNVLYLDMRAAFKENHMKDYKGAIIDCTEALKINSEDDKAYYNRSRAKYFLKDNQGAIDDLNKAIELNDKVAVYFHVLGQAWLSENNYPLAYANFSEAATLDPNDTEAVRLRDATAQGTQEQLQKILKFAEEQHRGAAPTAPASQPAPASSDASADNYFRHGITEFKSNQIDQAIADISQAIKLDPNNEKYFHSRGVIYNQSKKYDLAIADYDRALQLDPKNDDAYYGRGKAKHQLFKFDAAIEDFSAAIAIRPKSDYFLLRGYSYWAKRDARRAYENATQALNLNPDNKEALDLQKEASAELNGAGLTIPSAPTKTPPPPDLDKMLKEQLQLLPKGRRDFHLAPQ